MIRVVQVLVLVFLAFLMHGQISIDIRADKDTIGFGDEVSFMYRIKLPAGVEIEALDFSPINEVSNFSFDVFPEKYDSIMDIDVIDGAAFKIDDYNLLVTKDQFQGGIPLEGAVKVRVNSEGIMKLPKPRVKHSSGFRELNLQTPQLIVRALGEMEDINPNRNIIEEKVTWKDYLIYAYIYLGLATFILGLYFVITYLRKGKKEFEVNKVEVVLPADVVALRDLDLLKEKELWQNGDTKGYHTELTRIMRQYIEDRYQVQALEMTSSQLKREMNQKEINSDIVGRFDDILQIADKVKFAKGNTGPELNMKFMEEAYNIVAETKEVKKEKEDEQ